MDKREEFRQRYGPWAVIAGGTEGFGLAWTRAVAALGINTVIVARRKELLEKTAAEIAGRFGVETVPVECDLSLPEASSIVAAAAAEYEIGLVVYNACESIIGPFLSKSGDEHRKVIDTNCRGPLELVHHFGQRMVDQRRGGIILMSSMSCLHGAPMVGSYASTKAFNLTLAQSLWPEFRQFNVDIMACIAGATLTPNYINSKPEGATSSAPEMEPEKAVAEALDVLGKKPYMVPGFSNKFAVFMMRRLMGKKGPVSMVAKNMFKLYGSIT